MATRRAKARAKARELRGRLLSRELLQLERTRRLLRRGEVDVLLLGDSSCLTAAARDTDLRMIPDLISEQFGGARVVTLAGPGFNPRIHAEMVRVLSVLEQRPAAVVFSSAVRTSLVQVTGHPVYRYREVLDALARSDGRGRIRSLGRGNRATPEDYAAFDAMEVVTRWGGRTTMGDFRAAIKGTGPHPWPLPQRKLLFDYFHGELVPDDAPALEDWRELGRRLVEYGVPTVGYSPPAPTHHGETLYPGEFADQYLHNYGLFKAAFNSTAPGIPLVDLDIPDEDFELSPNGTEHFAFAGRQQIATRVVAALRAVGAPDRFPAR